MLSESFIQFCFLKDFIYCLFLLSCIFQPNMLHSALTSLQLCVEEGVGSKRRKARAEEVWREGKTALDCWWGQRSRFLG
jgi:hypothetical protein